MSQQQRQLVARDETWVPTADIIRISATNMRIDPTLPQKEETYQVILDIIKNSTCYNAFLITTDVSEIYMQQFWYIVKKIKNTTSYEFDLADKKGKVDVEKTRGKGSKGKKTTITPKKKGSISADDNIILEPDVALELGKSISQTEAEIAEEERRLYETHKRLVTAKPTGVDESDESDGEPANRPTRRRRPSGITFRGTLIVSKKKSLERSQKLKGIQVMNVEEQLAADTKKAIKASKEALRLQQRTGDSNYTREDDSYQSDEEYINVDDITWLSTNEEEKAKGDDEEEDDDRKKNVAEKVEEEKGDEEEERADDDQAQEDQAKDDIVGTLVTMS
ncbi:hypothetical protein Tco_1225457 [Tanacetum coccineum]